LTLDELLRDRSKILKLFWIGLISSLVFIGIGMVLIIMALMK
jgi:hypothetical protein